MDNKYLQNEFNKLFDSIDLKHQIEISVLDDISWFNINKIDYANIKTFLLLLKDILGYLSNKNIKYVKQYINKNDLELFTKSSFIELSDNVVIVSTKIEEFIPEIIDVFGINKL
jgi:hypothetical protein